VNGDEAAEESITLPRQPTNILAEDAAMAATDEDAGGITATLLGVTGSLASITGDPVGVGSLARFGVDMNASLTSGHRLTSRLSTAASSVSIISAT